MTAVVPSGRRAAMLAAVWLCLCAAGDSARAEEEWPQFRGPDGQGHSTARGMPMEWSETKNVVWKVRVPGAGWSSPVISGGKIWLTTCDVKEGTLQVLCYDTQQGQKLHHRTVFQTDKLGRIHPQNSHATPTMLVKRNRVYAHFGAHGTACLSTDAEVLWTTRLNYYHHHGPASSPVLVNDRLLISCNGFTGPFYDRTVREGVDDFQFLVSLDASTGVVQWKRPRQGRHAYSTPLVIDVNGITQVITADGDGVTACDPTTGEEIWRCRYRGYSVVPRPVYGNGLVFVCTGFDHPMLLAIRPGGRGDVTESHVAWTVNRSVPLNASPLLVGDKLYMISDAGVLSCLDANTGERLWRGRLTGRYWASPLYADERIFCPGESGVVQVIEPGPRFNRVASNRLDGSLFASMAVSGRAFYIRTEHYLYRIEEQGDHADAIQD